MVPPETMIEQACRSQDTYQSSAVHKRNNTSIQEEDCGCEEPIA